MQNILKVQILVAYVWINTRYLVLFLIFNLLYLNYCIHVMQLFQLFHHFQLLQRLVIGNFLAYLHIEQMIKLFSFIDPLCCHYRRLGVQRVFAFCCSYYSENFRWFELDAVLFNGVEELCQIGDQLIVSIALPFFAGLLVPVLCLRPTCYPCMDRGWQRFEGNQDLPRALYFVKV